MLIVRTVNINKVAPYYTSIGRSAIFYLFFIFTVIHCTEILAACLGVLPKVAGHGQNRSKIDH